jgi:hypothetical protein
MALFNFRTPPKCKGGSIGFSSNSGFCYSGLVKSDTVSPVLPGFEIGHFDLLTGLDMAKEKDIEQFGMR